MEGSSSCSGGDSDPLKAFDGSSDSVDVPSCDIELSLGDLLAEESLISTSFELLLDDILTIL